MINNVTLVGRLTKDPDLRYTGSGVAVANFTIAINCPYKNSNGERDADFINCVIWREAAENINNLCSKGMMIGVTGRIQTRTYEDNDGKTIFVTEVYTDNFQILEKREQTQSQNTQSNLQETIHNQQRQQNNGSFDSSDSSINITDNDLPF